MTFLEAFPVSVQVMLEHHSVDVEFKRQIEVKNITG